jgi:hypothetical protein
MKFFDYKFLILLGLTLVVYFIYREVEYLRSKVIKIETEINQKKITLNEPNLREHNVIPQEIISKPTLQKPVEIIPPSIKNNNIPSKSPEKIISLDLVSQSIQQKNFCNNSRENKNITTISEENKNTTTNVESESSSEDNKNTTTVVESESSKHLAIYSNDNEHYDSTQNSLIDSVEATKFNVENPDLKSTMNNIIDNLSSEKEINQKEINEIIMEKEKQLSEMSSNSESKQKQSSETSNKTTNKKLTEVELNEKKLIDIKEIASKLNIVMSKKVNGQQKPKTKQDLIHDILLK